jgi:hypothetical protein
MALKDQTKRAKPLGCRNDVVELMNNSENGKISLMRNHSQRKKGESDLPPFLDTF